MTTPESLFALTNKTHKRIIVIAEEKSRKEQTPYEDEIAYLKGETTDQETEEIACLEAGALFYMLDTIPLSIASTLAVNAAETYAEKMPPTNATITVGNISVVLNEVTREISNDNEKRRFTEKELTIFNVLAKGSSTINSIMAAAWPDQKFVPISRLRTHIYRIREKLDPFGISVDCFDRTYSLSEKEPTNSSCSETC